MNPRIVHRGRISMQLNTSRCKSNSTKDNEEPEEDDSLSPIVKTNRLGVTHKVDKYQISRFHRCGTLKSLKRHLDNGSWEPVERRRFGDVVKMCTDVDTYRQSMRLYSFWQSIQIDGKEYPVFLSHITNGGTGPSSTGAQWYQESISWRIKSARFPSAGRFISPAHCIYDEEPSHGELFVSEHDDQRYSLEELGEIKKWLNELLKNYPATLERVCDYAATAASKASDHEINLAALELVEFLKEASERVVDDEQNLCNRLLRAYRRFTGRRRNNHTVTIYPKVLPPATTCNFLTGSAKHLRDVRHISELKILPERELYTQILKKEMVKTEEIGHTLSVEPRMVLKAKSKSNMGVRG